MPRFLMVHDLFYPVLAAISGRWGLQCSCAWTSLLCCVTSFFLYEKAWKHEDLGLHESQCRQSRDQLGSIITQLFILLRFSNKEHASTRSICKLRWSKKKSRCWVINNDDDELNTSTQFITELTWLKCLSFLQWTSGEARCPLNGCCLRWFPVYWWSTHTGQGPLLHMSVNDKENIK